VSFCFQSFLLERLPTESVRTLARNGHRNRFELVQRIQHVRQFGVTDGIGCIAIGQHTDLVGHLFAFRAAPALATVALANGPHQKTGEVRVAQIEQLELRTFTISCFSFVETDIHLHPFCKRHTRP
jgi:hypothetical protein